MKKGFWGGVLQYRTLLLMLLLAVVFFFIFAYIPIVGVVPASNSSITTGGYSAVPGTDSIIFDSSSSQELRGL